MRKKKRKYARVLLIVAAATIGILAGVAYYTLRPSLPEESSVARPYPALYSDARITKNAIESNPRFADQEYFTRKNILAAALLSLTGRKGPPSSAAGYESGTWLWTPMQAITPQYRTEVIQGAKESGITVMYVSLDSYLDIFVMPEGKEKDEQMREYDARVEAFLEEAHENGIRVDAEGGWRNWAEPGHTYKPYALLEYVLEYNRTHEVKFRGFQYDVEPYLLERYQEGKRSVLGNLVALVDGTAAKLAGEDLAFSVVIPEFFDGAGGETPHSFYGLHYGTTFDHLLAVLEQKPGSTIIVMSYRNEAEGEDGSIAITRSEIERANRSSARVVVAQETGNFPPPYISFFGKSRADLDREISKIEEAFAKEPSYAGVAVHYINALMALE